MFQANGFQSTDAEKLQDAKRKAAGQATAARIGATAMMSSAMGGAAVTSPLGPLTTAVPGHLSGAVDIDEDELDLDSIDNILELEEGRYPKFTLAKNKARFLRMVSWYKNKQDWLDVAPLSGVTKLFKQQTKELVGIRSHKLDYEMELETGTLTPSQRSYRRDELKMCKVHEKMAVNLISKMQVKIKSGRR